MGKNKERLQVNNLDLSAILSGIQNLPPAGGEDLQSTAEAQTTAVTELLKMVNRKVADHKGEGEYVWKKEIRTGENVWLDIERVGSYITSGLKIKGVGIDFANIDTTFFEGMIFTSPTACKLEFKADGVCTYWYTASSSADGTYSYTPSTSDDGGTISISGTGTRNQPTTWNRCVISEQTIEFCSCVIGTSEDTYPSYGEDGGFWYTLLKQGVDYGEVTLTSAITSNGSPVVVSHNLGVVPSIATVFVKDYDKGKYNKSYQNINGHTFQRKSDDTVVTDGGNMYRSPNTITFDRCATQTLYTGTYVWIALA